MITRTTTQPGTPAPPASVAAPTPIRLGDLLPRRNVVGGTAGPKLLFGVVEGPRRRRTPWAGGPAQ